MVLDIQTTAEKLTRAVKEKILKAKPAVVFIDLGPDPAGIGEIQQLTQDHPELLLIVSGPALSADGLLAVMRTGVTEYLPRPVSQEDTLAAFLRVRKRTVSTSASPKKDMGRVVTVFSAKGGTGVTTVATNLATALRLRTEKAVLLLDLNEAMGTASVAMGVQPRYSYVDVIRNFHRLDEDLFESFMEMHESGVRLLASPAAPMDVDPPTDADLRGLLNLCRRYFDFVVIDGGTSITQKLLATLQESDERMMVVTPELPSLRNLKQALDLYVHTNGKSPPKVVLNQYKEGSGLSSSDVEDGLGHRLAVILDRDDVRIPKSVNLGRPEVLSGKSKFSKNFIELVEELAGPESLISSSNGFLNRIFRSSKSAEKAEKETD
jgi:pilus assembly protein CpaE